MPTRLALIVVLLLLPTSAAAQGELFYLRLDREGQASVAIDKDAAHIVDLGRRNSVETITLDGRTLAQALEMRGVRKLVISCTHPHDDHLGGLKTLIEDPQTWSTAKGERRFDSIVLVDAMDSGERSLAKIFKDAPIPPEVRPPSVVHHVVTGGKEAKNVYDGLFTGKRLAVFAIPYDFPSSDIHDRSLIILTVIDGRYSVLDTDDASSAAIEAALPQLEERLKAEGIRLGTVALPHHGSKRHDIAPLVSLKPRSFVIAVNPSNRFQHPSPETLEVIFDYLQPDKRKPIPTGRLYFTGDAHKNVRITRNGIRTRQTRAMLIEYADRYVRPVASWLLRRPEPRTDRIKTTTRVIERLTRDAPRGGVPTEPLVMASSLSPEAGIARGASPMPSVPTGPLPGLTEVTATVGVPISADIDKLPESARALVEAMSLDEKSALATAVGVASKDGHPPTMLAVVDSNGRALAKLPLEPSVIESVSTVLANAGRVPDGGMVYMAGGRLQFMTSPDVLHAAMLDVCEEKPCLRFPRPELNPGKKESVSLPFEFDALFAETWRRAYVDQVDAFYLSINPTRSSVLDSFDGNVPRDRLRFGGDPVPADAQNLVVTTEPDSIIGDVLWRADVLFKSYGLGFDVLTGRALESPLPGEIEELLGRSPQALDAGLEKRGTQAGRTVRGGARWCRYYWSSSPQSVHITTGNELVLDGPAVVAKAEALVPTASGELEPYPTGDWCAGAIGVAERLNAELRARHENPVVRSLEYVGRAQNLAKWARESGIEVTEAFSQRASLESDPVAVPTWTSGIGSETKTFVWVDDWSESSHDQFRLRIASSDPRAEELLSRGHQRLVDFMMSFPVDMNSNVQVAGHRIRSELQSIARWLGEPDWVTTRPGRLGANVSDPDRGETRTRLHPLPDYIHGGALLESLGWNRRQRATTALPALLPDGTPFTHLASDGSLHVWVVGDGRQPTDEHIVVHGSTLLGVTASNGTLRIELARRPETSYLHEVSVASRSPRETAREYSIDSPLSEDPPGPTRVVWGVRGRDGSLAHRAGYFAAPKLVPTRREGYENVTCTGLPRMRIALRDVTEESFVLVVQPPGVRSTLQARWRGVSKQRDLVQAVRLGIGIAADQLRWGFVSDLRSSVATMERWLAGSRKAVDTLLAERFLGSGPR